MKIVYIAGPYGDAGGYMAIDRNIDRARDAAAWLAAHGVGFLCPHMNTAHFEAILPHVPVEFWYEMDLRLMPVCDALLVLEGWEDSKGTQAEMTAWSTTGKPMFYEGIDNDMLMDWAADVPTGALT